MRLLNIRLGTNDLARARVFYDATFGALELPPSQTPDNYPIVMYKVPGGHGFSVGRARDGAPATHANGGTLLFEADSESQVRAWHSAGLLNGGTCAGRPESKPQARGAFGAYLRDPDGNKLGVYFGLKIG